MADWNDILKGIIRQAGTVGVKELEGALEDLEQEAKEPWKKALLQIAAESVAEYGLEGVNFVENLVDDVSRGRPPRLDFVSLKARSDYLAALQNMEDSQRRDAGKFFDNIGIIIGKMVKAIICGIIE